MAGPRTILHIPHDSRIIPPDVRVAFVLSESALRAELNAMTDAFTAELFDPPEPVMRCIYPVSRLVVDPERFVDDTVEPMARRGMGVIYTRTSEGAPLRVAPDPATRAALLARFYWPHHAALTAATDGALVAHGRCRILDCHSFAAVALPYELDQAPTRPDICLGTDPFHTPPALYERADALFRAAGFTVARDRPFAGTMVPSSHYRKTRAVESLMIEVNRGLYLDSTTGARGSGFDALRQALTPILSALVRTDT